MSRAARDRRARRCVIDYKETEFVYFSSYQYESATNGFLTFSRLNWPKIISIGLFLRKRANNCTLTTGNSAKKISRNFLNFGPNYIIFGANLIEKTWGIDWRHFRKDLIRNAELQICHCLARNIVWPRWFWASISCQRAAQEGTFHGEGKSALYRPQIEKDWQTLYSCQTNT